MIRDEMISELAKITPRYAYNCKDFIPGKTPVYYSGPYWDHRELEMAMKALLTGKWLSSGEYVQRFQHTFAEYFDVNHAHMVNSGSSANLVMIAALKKHLKWKDGNEIIVSPVGFPTTIAPIVQNGLKPVFTDIEMNTLNFDLDEVEKKITSKTVAIFVSPVLGNPPDMDRLKAICEREYEKSRQVIKLIGDSCDSIGSRYNGKNLSTYYYSWSASFYPAHHITAGEGGMVCSDDEGLIDQARSISWWGRDCHCVGVSNLLPCGTCGNRFDKWLGEEQGIVDHKYVFTNMGYNLKPLDLQGAIGLAQMEKIGEIERLRRENFSRFSDILMNHIDNIRIASFLPNADPCWFAIPIICRTPELKQKIVSFLESHKIQTRNYFAGNILLHPAYSHLDNSANYPKSNLTLSNVFFVGCPPHYNDEIFKYIEEVLGQWK